MIIMPYYNLGDLIHFLNIDFYNISWNKKLNRLLDIISGLVNIHSVDIIHRDFHSGNIFFSYTAVIGDLGISKSATESTDDNENYGIIPYMAPEIFQRQKYTKASDIYSFGMIMWEFMTCRRPFWDRNHDTELIIEICDGLRPPIVTNAPEGYIELMKECWHSDPNERPTAIDLYNKIKEMLSNEYSRKKNKNPTEIIESSDIGPVTMNNPGAIYKSRPLSGMIHSAISLRSSRSQSITSDDPFYYYQKNNMTSAVKRKFEDALIEKSNDNDNYTKEFELDINMNFNLSHNNEYITKEIDFDINAL
ncbi:kinase-like domain-containing protein [Glomus cerebriforme]|uniref:Kinase-like domain-containing protein n=1 Tax=Glomus cerebriforme TaxID=658196 RepID=A0A397TB67_9GLOM|nr:kinase-like domain-containing protein [Glomus cerebriforme]